MSKFWPLLLSLCSALALTVTLTAHAQPAAGNAPLRFDILAFNVAGNTVLGSDEIEQAVYPFLGESKTLADAEAARAALERAYAARGFLSVAVVLPPQAAVEGELTLQVVEAPVAQRRISGARFNLPGSLAEATPSIAPGQVPDFNELQAELTRLQARADLRVTPLVQAGAEPGQLDVELKVQDALALHGSAELNSKQAFNTPRGRLEAGVRYDNLFQSQHTLGLNLIVPPTQHQASTTWVLSYGLPVGEDRVSFSGVRSNSSTPTSVGGATITRGESLGARWRRPLAGGEPGFSHGATLGLDWKVNTDASQNVAGFSTQNPTLRYPVYSLAYDLYDGRSEGASTVFDASVAFGTGAFGARNVDCNGRVLDQFECKRAGASPNFQLLRLNVQRRMPVFGRWELSLRGQLQLAADPLASGEQMGAGGVDSVRGYYEYEQVGDQGLLLRAELASPPFATLGPVRLQGLLFGDRARLRVNQALAAEQSDISLGSVGFSLRGQSADGLLLRLDLALPLMATLKADSTGALLPASGRDSRNRRRVDFSARYAF
jgi:hemolysin activation/secretion protein